MDVYVVLGGLPSLFRSASSGFIQGVPIRIHQENWEPALALQDAFFFFHAILRWSYWILPCFALREDHVDERLFYFPYSLQQNVPLEVLGWIGYHTLRIEKAIIDNGWIVGIRSGIWGLVFSMQALNECCFCWGCCICYNTNAFCRAGNHIPVKYESIRQTYKIWKGRSKLSFKLISFSFFFFFPPSLPNFLSSYIYVCSKSHRGLFTAEWDTTKYKGWHLQLVLVFIWHL